MTQDLTIIGFTLLGAALAGLLLWGLSAYVGSDGHSRRYHRKHAVGNDPDLRRWFDIGWRAAGDSFDTRNLPSTYFDPDLLMTVGAPDPRHHPEAWDAFKEGAYWKRETNRVNARPSII